MNQTTKRVLFSVMAVIVLLTACAPAPAPTQDPAQLQDQIEKAVALTLAAESAEAAQVLTAEPTNTPLPTQTEVVPPTPTLVLPTATPFVIVPPTITVAPVISGGSGPVVKSEYSCSITNQKPLDNTIFKPGKSFDINWTIVNNGTKTMRAGLDVKFLSGPNMTTVTRVELPEIKPGGQYKVIIDAKAPSKAGFYVMTWMVEGKLCYPYTAINVAK